MKKRELRKWRETYTRWDGPTVTEGIRLAVHFDEKDYVKRIGARWAPDPSGKGGYWWIPCKDVYHSMPDGVPEIVNTFDDKIDPDAMADGQSRLEWLNNNMMVNGAHGNIDIDAITSLDLSDLAHEEHEIRMSLSGQVGTDHVYGHFYVYATVGVVSYTPNGDNPNIDYNREYMTMDQAREKWNEFMEQGYRPVSQDSS